MINWSYRPNNMHEDRSTNKDLLMVDLSKQPCDPYCWTEEIVESENEREIDLIDLIYP